MGWSDLPSELLITIASNLTEFTDHLRFRSVCSHWRSSLHSHSLRLPQQLPWLALPCTSSTHFYSLSEDRVYANPPPSVAENSNLFGSASGWFLSVTGRNSDISFSLINPFTGASIRLLSPVQCPDLLYSVGKILIWDRSDSVVVVGFSIQQGMFYCRLGEVAWVSIESQQYSNPSSITFYEGRFYILQDDTWQTVVLDGETLEQITVIDAPDDLDDLPFPIKARLCISSGELFYVMVKPAWIDWSYLVPDKPEVRRANLKDELVEWVEINDIGDRALFVDDLRCFSVKVEDNGLLRRNCIYSADSRASHDRRAYSISIFDLGNRSEKCLDCALSKFPVSVYYTSPPSWVLPSLS